MNENIKTETKSSKKVLLPRVEGLHRYQFSTGYAPRGRGSWAFALVQNPTPEAIFWAPYGTFTEAKKAAQKHFVGHFTIYLQS